LTSFIWQVALVSRERQNHRGLILGSPYQSQLLRTGQRAFPELLPLETRFGDSALIDSQGRSRDGTPYIRYLPANAPLNLY
jgi:hypothetical protein